MEKHTEDTTDRTLDLHECILHHILSYLKTHKELARMSVLSKNWLAVTASYPVLDFNFHLFYNGLKSSSVYADKSKKAAREMYFQYVTYTTSRFCEQQNVSADTLILATTLEYPAEKDIIDRCLGLILMKGVKVLVIDIECFLYTKPPILMYRLPNILLYASSLTCLKIYRCELPLSLMVDVVKFKSLKRLELAFVPLNEEIIKRLTMSCPLLEILIVNDCYGFKRFSVYGHQNLQKVWIYFKAELERIDIEAPNVYYLLLSDLRKRGAPYLNLASCQKLTTLAYFGYPSLTSNDLTSFVSNFPSLETLVLHLPDKYNNKNLRLSSHSLETFVLYSEFELEEIDINIPNLLLFSYQGRTSHITFPPLGRKLSLSEVCMKCHPAGVVNALWFQKLRRFLDKKTRFKMLKLRIHALWDLIDEVEELKVIQSAPYELGQVVLEPSSIEEVPVYVAVVEAILWCCRPQCLTLYLPCTNFEGWSHIVTFTYQKLLQREVEGVTNIQIVLWSLSSKDKKHFGDLQSFLTALPSDRQGKIITFIMKKDLELAKDPTQSRVASKRGWSCFGCFK